MMSLFLGKIYYCFVIFKILIFWQIPHISPTRDSPKKPRAKEPSTPSKISKSERQITFDAAMYVSFNC